MAKVHNFLCNYFSKSADSEQILARQIILDSLELAGIKPVPFLSRVVSTNHYMGLGLCKLSSKLVQQFLI